MSDLVGRAAANEMGRLRGELEAAERRAEHAEARAERLREAVEQLRGMLALSRRPASPPAAPAPTAFAAGASTSQVVYPSPPAPPAPAAAAEDVAAVQGVIDARGNPAAQHAWERLRAAIEAVRRAGPRVTGLARDDAGVWHAFEDPAEMRSFIADPAGWRVVEWTDRLEWHPRAASPPAAPAPCPECGGCRACLGAGRLVNWLTAEWVPCERCRDRESARSA